MAIILQKQFFEGQTLEVAQQLLGSLLVREYRGRVTKARITDVEAYVGEDDLACHASRGRTPRTEVMYGEPGHAYVYLVYGMYHCLNIVTERAGFPAAVLVRGVKIEGVEYKKTNGPGKLCRELRIDKKLNGWDVTKGEKLWIEKGKNIPSEYIRATQRIGIDYAKHCRQYLWRFVVDLEGYSK